MIVAGELIGIIGAILTFVLPLDNIAGRMIGLWMAKFFLGPYIISLELNIANISGHTKKTTVSQPAIYVCPNAYEMIRSKL